MFDHGAQYISTPKSVDFHNILMEWKEKSVIAEWKGNFGIMKSSVISPAPSSERYVGVPYMNSICKYLVGVDSSIVTQFGRRIRVQPIIQSKSINQDEVISGWNVICNSNNEDLGTYDFLISSDRGFKVLSEDFNVIPQALHPLYLNYLQNTVNSVTSAPILATMIVMKRSIPRDLFGYDGITFQWTEGSDQENNNILGWIARDSSKPNRYEY
mmetsp:Transcript_7647/g.11447  ORF Transcript_7647/g.11447 Transcript_7647/m.11447 type:complete len:213 (-) Transcript_7647:49-687(-)